MKYLIDNRVIYRRLPITDEPSEVFDWGWFYKDGTHEYYNLFNSPAKINTYKSLKWHLLVLRHLNGDLTEKQFKKLADYIANKNNGFCTFSPSNNMIHNLLDEFNEIDLEKPPKNRIKKVIFKDFIPLTKNEKLSIVGTLLGRGSKASPQNIYECMIALNDLGEKITISKIAKHLNCTTRTVYRNMENDLKIEKDKLNEEIQCAKLRTA
jgi:hypothetical protein